MANAVRTVSFVRHLELKVDRDVLPNAIKLGDVDNDKGNELVVGTISGMLYVFRGHDKQPIWEHSDLGFITCLTVGDVLHENSNSLIVINDEGYCRIYSSQKLSSNLKLVHTQLVKGNSRTVLLADVDNDGQLELLMSHTDRMVTAYRWDNEKRELVFLQDWHLRNQIGNITLHHNSENEAIIIASQPGAMWAKLEVAWNSKDALEENLKDPYNVEYSVMPRAHNQSVTCQIVGDILKGSQSTSGYFAICTLDGNIKLVEDGETLWSFQVDYQLFAIAKLDVLGNGKEEVIICSYDGHTYIIDHDKNVVRYQFDDTVKAFCAGQYAIDGCDENVPCLLYVDYKNQIKLYYDIELPHLQATDFLSYIEKDDEITEVFQRLNLKTREEKRKFVQYFMYKHPALKKT